MSDYTLPHAELLLLRAKLRRAVNSKNHATITKTVAQAMQVFEQKGYPDDWSNWQRAKDDADFAKNQPAW